MLQKFKARDLMTTDYAAVPPSLAVEDLVDDHILKKKERVFLVMDGNDLQGIVCLEDVKSAPRGEWPSTLVQDIMTPRDKLEAVSPDDDGNQVLTRLTVWGALYVTLVCLIPEILISQFRVPFYFGGTSLMIIVVVIMDFIAQLQAHLMSHQYEGLMKKANLRGYGRPGSVR
jgi:hypothetical protein